MTAQRLLVVEDEAHLASGLKLNFELEGFAVDVATTVREAGARLLDGRYQLIVLDVMLPDGDGVSFCKRLRAAGDFTPVLMLTARGEAQNRIEGLDAGADDYLPKPFELSELLARVRSLIRRRDWDQQPGEETEKGPAQLCFGEAKVDFETHEAWAFGKGLRLTQLELDLVRYFGRHPGRVLSREELLENVWRLPRSSNTRTVDNFIVRLRRYFEPDPEKPVYFVSHRGVGYKFVPSPL